MKVYAVHEAGSACTAAGHPGDTVLKKVSGIFGHLGLIRTTTIRTTTGRIITTRTKTGQWVERFHLRSPGVMTCLIHRGQKFIDSGKLTEYPIRRSTFCPL